MDNSKCRPSVLSGIPLAFPTRTFNSATLIRSLEYQAQPMCPGPTLNDVEWLLLRRFKTAARAGDGPTTGPVRVATMRSSQVPRDRPTERTDQCLGHCSHCEPHECPEMPPRCPLPDLPVPPCLRRDAPMPLTPPWLHLA